MKWADALIVFNFEHTFDCEFKISRNIGHCKKLYFSIKDIFSKCEHTCRKLQICSQSLKTLKKSLMGNFIFSAKDVIAKLHFSIY